MQKIENAVARVQEALRKRGIKECSIQQITWSVYRPIINWHHEHSTEVCSEELLESLCEWQRTRYEGGEISRKFYRSFVTASFRIRSYILTGEVDFSIVKDAKRYRPDGCYQELDKTILKSTDLTDGHQKKLSTPIRSFFCFLQKRNKRIGQICDKDFIDFIYEAAKTNKNNMTTVMRALKITAAYLNDQQLAKIKTDLSVFRPQTSSVHLIQPYTQYEISLVLTVIDSNSKIPMRDRTIILLAFNSGLRCVDIRNLKLENIDWKMQECLTAGWYYKNLLQTIPENT